MKEKQSLLLVLLATGLIQTAVAGEPRVWTSTSGSKIRAELVSASETEVVLKTEACRTISLAPAQLSDADRAFLKSLPAGTADASAMITEPDPDGWYAQRIDRDTRRFLVEFLLEAGATREFDVPAAGRSEVHVGFAAQESRTLNESYAEKDPYAIELRSRTDKSERLSSNIGGGMTFRAKSGRVRMSITNHSAVDTRILIVTDKAEEGETLRQGRVDGNRPAGFAALLGGFEPGQVHCVFEATMNWGKLYDVLVEIEAVAEPWRR